MNVTFLPTFALPVTASSAGNRSRAFSSCLPFAFSDSFTTLAFPEATE